MRADACTPFVSAQVSIALERARLTRNLGRTLRDICGVPSGFPAEPGDHAGEPDFHWDASCDTRYAHEVPSLGGVLHVFQQGWTGIRAAAGSLPGRKLAIRPEAPVPQPVLRKLARSIADAAPQRILVQGMSDVLGALVDELAAQGLHERLFVSLHGAPSQWFSTSEARYAFKCLALARSGKIRRLHVMKAGFEFPAARLYSPMLFNLPPCLSVEALEAGVALGTAQEERVSVLVPGWTGWRKNIHTNGLGAALSPRVAEVLAFGGNLALPQPLDAKIRLVPFVSREQTFALIQASALVMNVSLVDCHPMVHLEAQALGRACLRGPLFLDALEDHPYVRLTEVADVSSPGRIRSGVERVLDVPPDERRALVHDYQAASNRVALQRYHEFLEL
ncbi:hypothetical protein J2W24_003143 [Variovorax boronicumulans]|uniref:hypothetical protein n=1 Tax=Variovorax boronicumulans TaxID=436515 RepID=UPI002782D5BA|nr:hypothetical protein [Variovorax boronicumulans]MDP9917492.1 hypothetical protein [Variovorax boronicumulans]